MDRLIYSAMTGAKALMQRQDTLSHNLANANTNGYRADTVAFRAVPVRADGTATTRVHALEATAGYDPAGGAMMQTGRSLDIAVHGSGWIAVQGSDGNEAYTRAGALDVSADGTLTTRTGNPVLSDGGPISIPQGAQVTVGADGTVSARVPGQPQSTVGRIKLVNPPSTDLSKGADGLMRTADGQPAPADETVRVAEGVLESSNVNVVEAMIGMIAVSRQFDMQMRMLHGADQNAQRASQLLTTGR
jgi:flagellar basal-body rod protein FlgF